MVFGRIYDLEPQPQFFNAKQFKEEGFSKFKKLNEPLEEELYYL